MALLNYDQLQDTIRRYLWDRKDLSGLIPDWITLCEARLNNMLRVAQMETSGTITLTSGSGSLPSDYLAWRRVDTQDSPVRQLEMVSPDWATSVYPTAVTSLASYFTILGTTIKTYPQSSSNLTLYYYKVIPPLASNMTGNWVLTRHPGLYIYGTLLEAAPMLDDDPRITTWGGLFDDAVKALEVSDTTARYSRGVMRIKGDTP